MTFGVPDYDIIGIGNTDLTDIEENSLSHVSLLEQLDNQTSAQNSGEDTTNENNFGSSKTHKSGYQFASIAIGNSYYELILYKMMHFNVRKYPDEIITRNIILKGNIICLCF